ncbi:hypothetical protein HN873_050095 [Arachis hypogaea]
MKIAKAYTQGYEYVHPFKILETQSGFLNNLGELTSLRVLKVTSRGMLSENSLSLAAKSFPNLEVFHLKGMGVKEWILEKGAMSSLQHLIIKDCNWFELSEQLWSLTISTIMLNC